MNMHELAEHENKAAAQHNGALRVPSNSRLAFFETYGNLNEYVHSSVPYKTNMAHI